MAKKTWSKTRTNNLWRHSNGTYYARFSLAGKDKWVSLKTKLASVAKERLADELKAARNARTTASAEVGHITFERLIEIRTEEIEASAELKPSTKLYWRECLKVIGATWEGIDTQVRHANPEDFEAWANKLKGDYSPTRYNNVLSAMRTLLKMARKMGVIYGDPTEDIKRAKVTPKVPKMPKVEKFEEWLEEIDRVHGRGGSARGELVRFLAFSGLRWRSEAKWVTWADVDFEEGTLEVNGHPVTGTKGGEPRTIPLFPKLRELLESIRDGREDEPADGIVLRVFEAQKSMDRAAKVVGMKRLTQHDLRHWFTTRCVESGVDIPTVAGWLGHKDGGALLLRTYNQQRDEHSKAMGAKVNL